MIKRAILFVTGIPLILVAGDQVVSLFQADIQAAAAHSDIENLQKAFAECKLLVSSKQLQHLQITFYGREVEEKDPFSTPFNVVAEKLVEARSAIAMLDKPDKFTFPADFKGWRSERKRAGNLAKQLDALCEKLEVSVKNGLAFDSVRSDITRIKAEWAPPNEPKIKGSSVQKRLDFLGDCLALLDQTKNKAGEKHFRVLASITLDETEPSWARFRVVATTLALQWVNEMLPKSILYDTTVLVRHPFRRNDDPNLWVETKLDDITVLLPDGEVSLKDNPTLQFSDNPLKALLRNFKQATEKNPGGYKERLGPTEKSLVAYAYNEARKGEALSLEQIRNLLKTFEEKYISVAPRNYRIARKLNGKTEQVSIPIQEFAREAKIQYTQVQEVQKLLTKYKKLFE